ncbi:MAG: Cna B-type domain-containing protein, partial [Clostridia bacterium]|nr:Cna B-type domain-containing protein [Clostridia bacterium]
MKKILAFVLASVMLLTSMVTTTVQVFAADDGNEQTSTENAAPAGEGGGLRDVSGETSGGDTLEIDGIFSTLVLGATEQSNGDYVWTPENTNPDHMFKFTVTYSVSGEFDYFEKEQIAIHIPYTILKDHDGEPADYFDISLPFENDTNLTNDNVFVYRIETLENGEKEIIVYNRLPCPAAQHGYFDIGYSTNKRTYDYMDYDPDGATPEDRNPSAEFQATLVISRNNEVHSETSDPAHVYINTTAKITNMEKYAPQKLYSSWQTSSWGAAPEDDNGQYYYLIWQVRSYITATQRYDFSLVDTFNVTGGEVVAIKMQGQNKYVPITDENCGKVYNQTVSYPGGRYDNIITRHAKDPYADMPTYSFTNRADGHVDPLDGIDSPTDAYATKRWAYERPVFQPGSGVGLSFDKYGLDFKDQRVYDSEDVRTFTLDDYHNETSDTIPNLAWYTSTAATTYALTVPEGADRTDPNNYFLVPATVELTDNTIKVRMIGETGGTALVPGEYRFDKVVISYTMLDAYFDAASQSFKTKTVTYEPNEAIKIFAQFGTDEWVEVGSFACANATFTPTSEGTAHSVTASGKTITFGDGTCTGYRLVATNKHYRTTLGAKPYATLLRCEKVTNVVDQAYRVAQNEFAIVNTARTAVYAAPDNTGTAYKTAAVSGVDYVIGVTRQSEIKKTVRFKNDPLKKRCLLTWTITMNETSQIQNGSRIYVEQKSGVFYDLLPYGGNFDKSSLVVSADGYRLNPNQYSSETITNYNGSGRTLLIVRITEPAKRTYSFNYQTSHSWDSIAEFGNHVHNSVAYETGNDDIGDGLPDNGGSLIDRVLMTDLDPDTNAKKFIYAQCSHDIVALTAGNLGLYKKVMAEGDADYEYATTTVDGGSYSYKIHFATDAATWVKDMIIFDSLENFVLNDGVTTSDWHGILQGFDLTVLEANDIAPVLYYSKVENLSIPSLNATEDYDFSQHDDIWIAATGPSDPNFAEATAFAIDIRKLKSGQPFVMDPSRAITAIVYMKAPDALDSEATDPTAYNNIYLFNSVKFGHDSEFADASLNHQDYTRITFRQIADIEVLKVDYDIYSTTGELVPIPGITFRLFGDSYYGDFIDYTYTTNSQGIITFRDLPRGTYTLQEQDGTDDFVEDHTEMTVTVDHNGNVFIGDPVGDGTYTYEPYGDIVIGYNEDEEAWVLSNKERVHGDLDFDKLGKVSGTAYTTPLGNVSFHIYGTSYYSQDINMIVTSGGDGVVHIKNLERGTYTMVETSPAEHYFPLDTEFTVICDANGIITISYVDEDGNTVYPLENGNFTIINTPYYELKLWKYNKATNNAVPGATFKLTGDNYYDEKTSGSDGIILFENLVPGAYVLKELVAPEGFELDEESHAVLVDEDGNVTIDGKTMQQFIDEYLTGSSASGTGLDYFPIPNTPKKGTITIIKEWVGLAEGETPDVTPVLHLDTTKPDPNIPEATIDKNAWSTYVSNVSIAEAGSLSSAHGLFQQSLNWNTDPGTGSNDKVRIEVVEFKKYENRAIPTAEQMNQTIEESWADLAEATAAMNQYIFTDETIGRLEQWRRIDDGSTNYRIFIKLEFIEILTEGYNRARYRAVWWSDAPNVYLPEDASKMFAGSYYMTGTIDLRGIKSSRTKNMTSMFESCRCTGVRLDFDTSNVTTMARMFRNCYTTSLADIVTFDTSNVTDMFFMLGMCRNLTSVDITHWDTSKVTNMQSMFRNNYFVGALDFSMLDFSSVTDMSYMFYNTVDVPDTQLTSVKFPTNMSSVTTMKEIFRNNKSIVTVDMHGANLSSLTNLDSAFCQCTSLVTLDMGGADCSNLSNDLFQLVTNCSSIKTIHFPDDLRKLSWFTGFNLLRTLENVTMPTHLENVVSFQNCFEGDTALKAVDMSYCIMPKVVNFMNTFGGCSSLTSILMPEGANMLSNVKSFWMMCSNCTSLTSFDLSGRDLSGVIDEWGDSTAGFEWMFQNCTSLQSVNFSGSYAPNTMVAYEMFRNCSNLKTCNMEGFILGGPDTVYGGGSWYMMFFGCSSLEEIDISGFYNPDANHKANVYYMFGNCTSLATIYASAEWPTEGFTPHTTGGSLSCYFMFHGCTLLHNDGYDSAHPENNKNYCTFTTNTTLPGNFTYKAAPAVPTFVSTVSAPSYMGANVSGGAVRLYDGEEPENGTQQNISYTSEANKWVHIDGDTWSYTFDVYDVDGTYYLWESALPGYGSDCTIDNPIEIHYTAGGAITTVPADRLVEYEQGKYGVKITNTKVIPDYVSIIINKVVTGVEDTETEFTIHIEVTDLEGNPVPDALYGDVTLLDGAADITLKHNGVASISDLPAGVIYTVTEVLEDEDEYEVTITNATGTLTEAGAKVYVTIENHKDEPPTVGLDVTKVVTHDDTAELTDEDLKRAFSVTITLYTDSTFETVATEIDGLYGDVYFNDGVGSLMLLHDQTAHVTGLPTVDETGAELELWYKVEEAYVEGFRVTYTGQTGKPAETPVSAVITNTKFTPPTGGFKVTKVLDGAQEGDTTEFHFNVVFYDLTPNTDYTYTIDGTEHTFTSLATGGWYEEFTLTHGQTAIFTGLPENSGYVVSEESSGFIASYTVESNKSVASASGKNNLPYISLSTSEENVEDGEDATITFTNTPALVDIEGHKEWVGDDDIAEIVRPDHIDIYLMAGTAQIDSLTVYPDEHGYWSWSFTGLAKYDNSGKEIIYTIEEDVVDGYETTYSGYNVTNTYIREYIDIPVQKLWQDNNNSGNTRPGSIVLNLYADEVLKESVSVYADLETGNWSYVFEHLPKYRTGSTTEEVEYTVTENAVGGYVGVVSGSMTNGFVIANTLITNIEGEKTWLDGEGENRPESITIHLLADGEDTGKYFVATEDTNWSWSFSNLPVYKIVDDEYVEIAYTITEDEVAGYTSSVVGYNVINTELTEATVVKIWNDSNDQDDIRPDVLTVQLYAGDQAYGEPTELTVRNNWSATVSSLPKYDAENELIVYSWQELDLPEGYELTDTSINGTITTFTNTHTVDKIKVVVIKVWDDTNDQDDLRPESIFVQLTADGEAYGEPVELSDDNDWTYTWEGLDKNSGGEAIVYEVDEVEIPEGYEKEVTHSEEGDVITYTITNSHTTDKTKVVVLKVWDDTNDQDDLRPESIFV